MPDKDYSTTPLHKKLGIKPGSSLALVNPPVGFLDELRPLPEDVALKSLRSPGLDVIVLFTRSSEELSARFPEASSKLAPTGGLWVSWPRDRTRSDLNSLSVQAIGLRRGLVDNKVARFNEDWTSMRFVVRVEDRPGWGG